MLNAIEKALVALITKNPALLESVVEALLNLLLKELQTKVKA